MAVRPKKTKKRATVPVDVVRVITDGDGYYAIQFLRARERTPYPYIGVSIPLAEGTLILFRCAMSIPDEDVEVQLSVDNWQIHITPDMVGYSLHGSDLVEWFTLVGNDRDRLYRESIAKEISLPRGMP